jgi:hypothetical protein
VTSVRRRSSGVRPLQRRNARWKLDRSW